MIKNIRQRPKDFDDLDPEELAMLGPGPFLDPRIVCTYCGDEFPSEVIEKDHIIPISRGGRDTKANRVPSCRSCNRNKGIKTPGEWLAELSMCGSDDPIANRVVPRLVSLLDSLDEH